MTDALYRLAFHIVMKRVADRHDGGKIAGFCDALNNYLPREQKDRLAQRPESPATAKARENVQRKWANLGVAMQQYVAREAQRLGHADALAGVVGELPDPADTPNRGSPPEPMF